MPRVSVVVPAYNAAAFIEAALDSVAVQTYRDFELIVIDDGSQDGTAAKAESFLSRRGLEGFCLRQANKKIAGARNAGASRARGELLAFLDSDDRWLPAKLETVVREFDSHPESDVICHAERIVEQGRPAKVRRYGPARDDMYSFQLWGGCALSTSATTLRKKAFEGAGGFRENPEFNTVEDYDLWMRLGKTCRFRFLDQVLGEYRVEAYNSTRRIAYHHANLESLLRAHFEALYGDRPGLLAQVRIKRRLAGVYRSALGLLMRYSESPEEQRLYASKMLRTFPFEPKNAARALSWLWRSLWKR